MVDLCTYWKNQPVQDSERIFPALSKWDWIVAARKIKPNILDIKWRGGTEIIIVIFL